MNLHFVVNNGLMVHHLNQIFCIRSWSLEMPLKGKEMYFHIDSLMDFAGVNKIDIFGNVSIFGNW